MNSEVKKIMKRIEEQQSQIDYLTSKIDEYGDCIAELYVAIGQEEDARYAKDDELEDMIHGISED